jgi:hypothetical protein
MERALPRAKAGRQTMRGACIGANSRSSGDLVNRNASMHAIVDRLSAIYEESVSNLREALSAYVRDRKPPNPKSRAKGVFAYPELKIDYAGKLPRPQLSRAFARLNQPSSPGSPLAGY